jgi:hypothetical protein
MAITLRIKSIEGVELELCLYTLKGLAELHKDITSYESLRKLTAKIAKGEHPPEWEGYRFIGRPRSVWLAYEPVDGLTVNLDQGLFDDLEDLESD